MSDTKELVAGLRRATRHVVARDARNGARMGDYYEPDEYAQRGAAWIERWAPVAEVARYLELARREIEDENSGCDQGAARAAYDEMRTALIQVTSKALGEDKP